MRRVAPAALVALVVLCGFAVMAAQTDPSAHYRDQKVVYHNDGGAPDNRAYFKRLLTNLRNHVDAVGKAHIDLKVVSHSAGVDLFTLANTDKELAERLDALRADGVQFLVCANTLKDRGLDWRALYGVKEEDVAPSGVAELARLQGMGYVYLHI